MKPLPVILAFSLTTLTLAAQPVGAGPRGGNFRPPPHIVEQALDRDSNYTLDAEEIADAGSNIMRLDTNGDGSVSSDEFEMTNLRGGFHPPTHPFATALDTNRDQRIDKSEVAEASRSLLRLDDNGDGQISFNEVHPKGFPGRPGGPGQAMLDGSQSTPPNRPGARRAPSGTTSDAVQRFMSLDKNGDNVITRNEIPDRLADLMLADADGDGHVSRSEARFFIDRLRPPSSPDNKRRKRGF